mmetsp:Transcript_136835/g.272903  ORF Transcript_136835/g.272903 Transcript_136835/m.272903 type:complete len:245 (-) Transcript_136835:409-1143(-)
MRSINLDASASNFCDAASSFLDTEANGSSNHVLNDGGFATMTEAVFASSTWASLAMHSAPCQTGPSASQRFCTTFWLCCCKGLLLGQEVKFSLENLITPMCSLSPTLALPNFASAFSKNVPTKWNLSSSNFEHFGVALLSFRRACNSASKSLNKSWIWAAATCCCCNPPFCAQSLSMSCPNTCRRSETHASLSSRSEQSGCSSTSTSRSSSLMERMDVGKGSTDGTKVGFAGAQAVVKDVIGVV